MALLVIPALSAPDFTPHDILPRQATDGDTTLKVTAFEECSCNTRQGKSKQYTLTKACKNIPPAPQIKYIRAFKTTETERPLRQCNIQVFSGPKCTGVKDLVTINLNGGCSNIDRPRDPDSLVKAQSAKLINCYTNIVWLDVRKQYRLRQCFRLGESLSNFGNLSFKKIVAHVCLPLIPKFFYILLY